MRFSSLLVAILFALAAAPGAALAQDTPAAPPMRLSLIARAGAAGLPAETLRAALEQELGVQVEPVAEASGAHLLIEGDALTAVRVAFVRDAGATVERTVDVSSTRAHAAEAVALVAANLMRDEAAELLAALAAARAAPAAPLAAAPAEAPAGPAAAPAPREHPPDPADEPEGCDRNALRPVAFGADFVPYLGSSTVHGTEVERAFSFNAVGGLTGAVRGFELGGIFNLEARALCGLQISALNLVLGPAQGAQLGLVDVASGRVDGVQLGLVEIALGALAGAQLGLVNLTTSRADGAQLGLTNVVAEDLEGAQLGLVNVASGGVAGAQLGLVNVGVAAQRGLQLGLANIAAGELAGAQVGLLNVAEEADAAFGLISVIARGRTHMDAWATDAGLLLVGVVHGGRAFHNVYGVGSGLREGRAMLVGAYGLGARVLAAEAIQLDVDAVGYALFLRDPAQDEIDIGNIVQLRVPLIYRITPAFAVFASPAINLSIAEADDNLLSDPTLYGGLRLTKRSSATVVRLWPGLSLGVRIF